MSTQKKVNIAIVSMLFLFFGWLVFQAYQKKQELKSSGVYVIGIKYKYTRGGNHAGVSFYNYFYANNKYEYSVADGGINKTRLFLHILPSEPTICRIIENVEVPNCLTMKDVPKEGWKELPEKFCN